MSDPELGPKQAALVDAVTTRLWSGLPLNNNDFMVVSCLFSVLDLLPTAPATDPADPGRTSP